MGGPGKIRVGVNESIHITGALKEKGRAMAALVVLFVTSLCTLAVGAVWTIVLHGQTTHRSGTQVGAEYMEERMSRQAFREGKTSVGRKAWFWGKAWAVDREAAFSYGEIKAMWKKGSYGAVLPMALALTGMVSSIILGGFLLWVTLDNPIPGLFVLALGLYGAWLIIGGIRRA